MNLSGLLPLLEDMPGYRRLIEGLRAQGAQTPLGLLRAARPYLIACLQRALEVPILVITAQTDEARRLHDQLLAWSERPQEVLLFPEPNTLFYERIPWAAETIRQRLQALTALAEGRAASSPIIVTSARAMMQKTTPLHDFGSGLRSFQRGQRAVISEMVALLYSLGYEPASVVERPGSFSRRGGIVDIFPPNNPQPVRIEFFGDEIESLRLFDPTIQRSQEIIPAVTISPASEALLYHGAEAGPILAELDLSTCHGPARMNFQRDLEALQRKERFRGMEFFIPYLYPEPGALLDYLPPKGLLITDDLTELEAAVDSLERQAIGLQEELTLGGELPAGFLRPYFTLGELRPRVQERGCLELGYHLGEGRVQSALSFVPGPRYGGQLERLIDDCQRMCREGQRVVIVSRQARRIAELFEERGVYVSPVEGIEGPPSPGSLTIVQGVLDEGWRLQIAGGELQSAICNLLTDAEIFGWTKPQPRRPPRQRGVSPESFFADLTVGDYVVHIEHGIGLFRGLVRMAVDGVEQEYLQVDYARGDKLYVPVHQADRISRYVGASDRPPTINRLGTVDWAQVKARTKRAVEDIAQELLELYAAREVIEGHAFSPDTLWQVELESSFPYVETPDQLQAIEDVKGDMERPKPMDRLICGDVGYGKTEVALRAAFKAVMDGKQVAMLVPTTVLAQQHFRTFKERLEPFPIFVEMLSRFRPPQEQQEILQNLRDGLVDIVIGTHRLLSDDVAFKDLGLLIIDEEQRFGVAHKERLKEMRREVDVLTLTATPIPRTLYMSLTGARDMSTIDTPPEERLPIVTYVAEYDEGLIRKAVLRELDRGGQIYFVHNRVQGIQQVAQRLRRLLPEAIIAVAHGQMDEGKLAQVMLDFVAGKMDVLVSTSIIESGLDIPNVNTLIVNQADSFGLAQLYQLRGRVGRSTRQAYAYFLHDGDQQLTDEARKRLQTILEASELGAGFRVAMRDLEIRGAGELLGRRQHGHISAVGFDLYCRLLAQAVQELKEEGGEKKEESLSSLLSPLSSVSIDLPLDAYLPEDYVPDSYLRLRLYRRMAGFTTLGQVEGMARELKDRFGEAPRPVENMFYLLRLKVLAAEAGVQAISTEAGQIVIEADGLGRWERSQLQRCLGLRARVGRGRIWLPLRKQAELWRGELMAVLESLKSLPLTSSLAPSLMGCL